MAWMGKEELIAKISEMEPNYNVSGLRARSEGQLYNIYQYLKAKKPRPRPTAVQVLKTEECDIGLENTHIYEELLYPKEIEMMYPEDGAPMTFPNSRTVLVNLSEGDGFRKRK